MERSRIDERNALEFIDLPSHRSILAFYSSRQVLFFQVEPIARILAEHVAQLVFGHTGNFLDFVHRVGEFGIPVAVVGGVHDLVMPMVSST